MGEETSAPSLPHAAVHCEPPWRTQVDVDIMTPADSDLAAIAWSYPQLDGATSVVGAAVGDFTYCFSC